MHGEGGSVGSGGFVMRERHCLVLKGGGGDSREEAMITLRNGTRSVTEKYVSTRERDGRGSSVGRSVISLTGRDEDGRTYRLARGM